MIITQKIKMMLVLALAGLLSGCVGIFLAGAAIGGAVVYEGRNIPTQKADFKLTSDAYNHIQADKVLVSHARIILSAYDGILLIAGQAPNEAMRERAKDLIQTVPHVRRVYNEVTIGPPISTIVQSNDAWITTKIRSQLVATKDLNSSQIKVVTENSTVFLLGKLTRRQAEMATQVARSVEGVQQVILLFEYEQ
jgi:osmotically-inducible protein OsmY